MQTIPFSIRQIEYLLAVRETGSTAAAARKQNVSQPSISVAVARFEAHFGTPFFLRQPGQGMQPTPFGRQKLAELHTLMVSAQSVLRTDGAGAAPPELTLGVFATLGPRHAPQLVRHFRNAHPDARVTLVEDDLTGLLTALQDGRLDLALIYDFGLPGDFALTPLADVRPHALVPAGHRLAEHPRISLTELCEDPIVLIGLPHSRDYFISLYRMNGASPRIAAETRSIEMFRSMVANGIGVGILATDLPHDMTHDGRKVVRLEIDGTLAPHRIALARSGHLPPTHAAELFTELAMRIFRG